MPNPTGESHLLDGTVILASGMHDVMGDPIQKTVNVCGQEITFDAVGIAAVRLDGRGHVEAIAAGGLKRVATQALTIDLPDRADLALWRDARGRWRGVLQGSTGVIPSGLLSLTTKLASPPLSRANGLRACLENLVSCSSRRTEAQTASGNGSNALDQSLLTSVAICLKRALRPPTPCPLSQGRVEKGAGTASSPCVEALPVGAGDEAVQPPKSSPGMGSGSRSCPPGMRQAKRALRRSEDRRRQLRVGGKAHGQGCLHSLSVASP